MKTSFLACTLCVLGASLVQTHALELVRDGKALVTIVCVTPPVVETTAVKGKAPKKKQGPDTDEALAVRTLVEWVKKMTDVVLPVAHHYRG